MLPLQYILEFCNVPRKKFKVVSQTRPPMFWLCEQVDLYWGKKKRQHLTKLAYYFASSKEKRFSNSRQDGRFFLCTRIWQYLKYLAPLTPHPSPNTWIFASFQQRLVSLCSSFKTVIKIIWKHSWKQMWVDACLHLLYIFPTPVNNGQIVWWSFDTTWML